MNLLIWIFKRYKKHMFHDSHKKQKSVKVTAWYRSKNVKTKYWYVLS